MTPRINKWLDFLDRVGWTGVQASIASIALYLSGEGVLTWKGAAIFVGAAVLAAVGKVVTGQNTGSDDTGALIGTSPIEPTVKDTNV